MEEKLPPGPIPGLGDELTRSGDWLFRWRSYPPLVSLAAVLVATSLDPVPYGGAAATSIWIAAGLMLGLLGLAIRGWAIGFAPQGTSGRGTLAMRADTLNTTGLYSAVRHPLYLGNLLLWVGVATISGRPSMVFLTLVLFWLVYERIMIAEERFLFGRFGPAFAEWAERTPAFVPSFRRWVPSSYDFHLRFLLGRDYHALFGFIVSSWAVVVVRSAAGAGSWSPGLGWWIYLGAGTVLFSLLHGLRKYTSLLRPTDR
jgi:protein-S-isoprenylcysteine O-methyltransferase Ste14